MTNSVTDHEDEQERGVRQALEARLNPGESLVAYTTGKIFGVTAPAFHIGLTGERLMCLPLKRGEPTAQAYGIQRDRLDSLKVRGFGLFASQLVVKLPEDRLDFRIRGGKWSRRAKAIARWGASDPAARPASDPAARGEQHLKQAFDFRSLGLMGPAQAELLAAERANPMLGAQPALLQPLRAQLAETRLAWRVAAGFLFGHVAVVGLLTGFVGLFGGLAAVGEYWDVDILISIGISFWLGVQLWRGQRQARINTVYATFAGIIVFGLLALGEGNLLALISQAAFSGSLWLALAGEGQRGRTWAAIALYVVGYLGLVALLLLLSLLAALVADL